MNTQSLLIDNVLFAKRGEHLSGELSVEQCARLVGLLPLASMEKGMGSIHYTLDGNEDAAGCLFLHLTVEVNLMVTCQRCLNPMPLSLDLQFNYLVSDQDVDNEDWDDNDECDVQEPSSVMDLIALIEDELIIALPIAPMHESACGSGVTQSGERPNPFAVLKGVIKT
ncbi:MAG: hypothetical protein FJY53_03795 [Betaproteobacteria bacterium]|nr:hypothetical protein [Betaproteobacteria bacterium]